MIKNIEMVIPLDFNGGVAKEVYYGDINYIQDNAYLLHKVEPILKYALERLGNPVKYERFYERYPHRGINSLALRVSTIKEYPIFIPDFIKEYKIEHN